MRPPMAFIAHTVKHGIKEGRDEVSGGANRQLIEGSGILQRGTSLPLRR